MKRFFCLILLTSGISCGSTANNEWVCGTTETAGQFSCSCNRNFQNPAGEASGPDSCPERPYTCCLVMLGAEPTLINGEPVGGGDGCICDASGFRTEAQCAAAEKESMAAVAAGHTGLIMQRVTSCPPSESVAQ